MASPHPCASQSDVFRNFSALLTGDELAWDRHRCWGPLQSKAAVFVMRCPAENHSTRTAIPQVRELFGTMFGWTRTPDAAGLSRSRRRVTESESVALWTRVQSWALAHAPPVGGLLPGMSVVAVDGSILHLPRSRSLTRAYPIPKDALELEQYHYPRANLVSAWDMERRVPLAWCLNSIKVGEREALLDLLPELPEQSVLLLDRGYPSRSVLGAIVASGRHVVMRMVAAEAGSWPEVAAFVASGQRSAIVPVTMQIGRVRRVTQVRLVLRAFDRGRPHRGELRDQMVVLTTLTDQAAVTDEAIVDLYHQRWGIETIHREMKTLAALERWHGTTKLLIRQEIHAVMCWFALGGAIAARAEADVAKTQREQGDERPTKRVNTRLLFAAVHKVLTWQCAIGNQHDAVVGYLRSHAENALDLMLHFMQRRRPGRWNDRVPKHPYARDIAK